MSAPARSMQFERDCEQPVARESLAVVLVGSGSSLFVAQPGTLARRQRRALE